MECLRHEVAGQKQLKQTKIERYWYWDHPLTGSGLQVWHKPLDGLHPLARTNEPSSTCISNQYRSMITWQSLSNYSACCNLDSFPCRHMIYSSSQTSLDLFAIRWCQRFCQQSSPQDTIGTPSTRFIQISVPGASRFSRFSDCEGLLPHPRQFGKVNVPCGWILSILDFQIQNTSICEHRKTAPFPTVSDRTKRAPSHWQDRHLEDRKSCTCRPVSTNTVSPPMEVKHHSLRHRLITDDQQIRMLLGQLCNSLAARQVAAQDQSLVNNLRVAEHCLLISRFLWLPWAPSAPIPQTPCQWGCASLPAISAQCMQRTTPYCWFISLFHSISILFNRTKYVQVVWHILRVNTHNFHTGPPQRRIDDEGRGLRS